MTRIIITNRTRRVELGGQWEGFGFQNGKLWTPERHEFLPHDLAWLSLTTGIVREFQRMMNSRHSADIRVDQGNVTLFADAVAKRIQG